MRGFFLDEPRNIKRYKICKFVWTNKMGDLNPVTGRYDGVLGYLHEEKGELQRIKGIFSWSPLNLAKFTNYLQFLPGDIFIRPLGLGSVNPELVGYLGIPFLATAFTPFQLIPDNQKVDQNLENYGLSSLFDFLVPSLTFLILFAACLLLYRVSLFLLARYKKPPSHWIGQSLQIQRNLQFKILYLFHLLFIFFNREFFEGRQQRIIQLDFSWFKPKNFFDSNNNFQFL